MDIPDEVKNLRVEMGLSRREFCEYYDIWCWSEKVYEFVKNRER